MANGVNGQSRRHGRVPGAPQDNTLGFRGMMRLNAAEAAIEGREIFKAGIGRDLRNPEGYRIEAYCGFD